MEIKSDDLFFFGHWAAPKKTLKKRCRQSSTHVVILNIVVVSLKILGRFRKLTKVHYVSFELSNIKGSGLKCGSFY